MPILGKRRTAIRWLQRVDVNGVLALQVGDDVLETGISGYVGKEQIRTRTAAELVDGVVGEKRLGRGTGAVAGKIRGLGRVLNCGDSTADVAASIPSRQQGHQSLVIIDIVRCAAGEKQVIAAVSHDAVGSVATDENIVATAADIAEVRNRVIFLPLS